MKPICIPSCARFSFSWQYFTARKRYELFTYFFSVVVSSPFDNFLPPSAVSAIPAVEKSRNNNDGGKIAILQSEYSIEQLKGDVHLKLLVTHLPVNFKGK